MEELKFHFHEYQFAAFLVWAVLTFAMFVKGNLGSLLGMTSFISVTSMVGYICLISFGILGAGFSKGLIFPDFDAYIEPFLLFLFGIPTVMLAILILWFLEIYRSERFQLTPFFYTAVSLYILWSVVKVHMNVIASI